MEGKKFVKRFVIVSAVLVSIVTFLIVGFNLGPPHTQAHDIFADRVSSGIERSWGWSDGGEVVCELDEIPFEDGVTFGCTVDARNELRGTYPITVVMHENGQFTYTNQIGRVGYSALLAARLLGR